jgi:hypothetical protein
VTAVVAALLALIAAASGIERTVDPALTAIAERRVVEAQADWRHAGSHLAWSVEVLLQQDPGAPDPPALAVEGWRSSPGHWAVLTDRRLTRIGCAAATTAAGAWYFACILAPAHGGALLPNTATAP